MQRRTFVVSLFVINVEAIGLLVRHGWLYAEPQSQPSFAKNLGSSNATEALT
ncbi:MAG: hypothetical protein ACLP05_07215 [Candidatus Kryptoniota bacterium]